MKTTTTSSKPCLPLTIRVTRKVAPLLGLTLGAGLLLSATMASALDPWETVDDPGSYAYAVRLAMDRSTGPSQGILYALGDDYDTLQSVTRRSLDGGNHWETVYTYGYDTTDGSTSRGVAVDPWGRVFVAMSSEAWQVHRSTDGGATWELVDELPFVTQMDGGMAIDGSGTVYVVGAIDVEVPSKKRQSTVQVRWTVRRSTDHGETWSTVDDFDFGSGAWAKGVTIANGSVYVVGLGRNNGDYWVVRRGDPQLDGSIVWTTVDTWQLTPGLESVANSVTVDSQGNLYALGEGREVVEVLSSGRGKQKVQQRQLKRWVIRSLPAGGQDWSTIASYYYDRDFSSYACDIAAAADGTVWATGYGNSDTGVHWVTLRLANLAGVWSAQESDLTDRMGIAILPDVNGGVLGGGSGPGNTWVVRRLMTQE